MAIYLSGAVAVLWLSGTYRVSRLIFGYIDIPGFVIATLVTVIFAGIALLLSGNKVKAIADFKIHSVPLWLVVLPTLVASVWATHFIYFDYALSMDEWMPRLQARIFLSGELTGQVGPEWRDYGRAMYHVFATYDPETGELASSYRPGMAAIIALFDTIGLGHYASAFLNAGAVYLVAIVTRQLSPNSHRAPIIAAILLATSQQAFAASLTSYSMTAHLFFNVLWLHLFLRDTVRAHFLAAIVGVITASLHQVHVHVLFALPFLLTLLRPFRLNLVLLYGSVYVVGHLAVISWDKVLVDQVSAQATGDANTTLENLARIIRLPDYSELATVWANLTRFVGWQSLAVIPLLLVLRSTGDSSRWMGILVASIAVSVLPYPFLMPDQGNGWGYRYLHGMLGHVAILAAVGWEQLSKWTDRDRAKAFVVGLLVASPVVMLPLRAVQIEHFVAPFASATKLAMSQDADVVIVDSLRVFVAGGLARTDPIAPSRPVVMDVGSLTPEQFTALCQTHTVKVLSVEELAPLGLITFTKEDLFDHEDYIYRSIALEDYEKWMDILQSSSCRRGA